jgi:hypothetical protein
MNATDGFRQLLEEQKENASRETRDWGVLKQEWVTSTQNLVDTIKKWLRPFVKDGLLQVEEDYFDMDEEDLEIYSVVGLRIRAPSHREVQVRASARMVLGAEGRVIIESGSRTATLLRKDGKWSWAIRAGGKLKTSPLDKESFLSVLGDMLQ